MHDHVLAPAWAHGRRAAVTTYGYMAAGGGRITRTVDGETTVIATVGEHAQALSQVLARYDLAPATHLYPLARALAGTRTDMPRLIRGVLAASPGIDEPVRNAAPDLWSTAAMLEGAKPGARTAVADIITGTLDGFGPVLVPATVTWFEEEDHHTYSTRIDLSGGLPALHREEIDDLIETLEDGRPAGLEPGLVATLTDWDTAFFTDMQSADWHTIEAQPDPVLITALKAFTA